MDLRAIERALRGSRVQAIVVDPRVLRRVIKSHRRLPGFGLQVPHDRCYALPREALLAIVDSTDSGDTAGLPSEVILLARPSSSELAGKAHADALRRLWRLSFHARVHIEIDRRIASGALTDATLRERIDHIGQSEFDEVRAILRHDDLLLPPAGDRETFAEFAALYLELRHFVPALLPTVFPGLPTDDTIDAILAADVDALALLDLCCPEGGDKVATLIRTPATTSPTFSAPPTLILGTVLGRSLPTAAGAARLLRAADGSRHRGNAVRSALLRAVAAVQILDPAPGLPPPDAAAGHAARQRDARAGVRLDLDVLGERLNAALRPHAGADAEEGQASVQWTSLLVILAEEAAARRGLRYPVEARLLYDLQRAALAHEQAHAAVDVYTWALSWGKRPVVRPLPALRELSIARHVHAAQKKVRHARVPRAERKLLSRTMDWARERADRNVRAALRPKLLDVLAQVGLKPANLPERVARDKLVEELLDQAVSRGFLSLGHLRDALSRNQLKLENLSSVGELYKGDALLRADRVLAESLDGVYRGGEIYLRAMQKGSSIAFGTNAGRILTLYLALPLGGAFVLLEGVNHVVGPLSSAIGTGEIHLLTPTIFLGASAVLFALLHSQAIRTAARRLLGVLGIVLAMVFLRLPRWVLTRPAVRRAIESRLTKAALRRVVVPLAITAGVYFATPLPELGLAPALGIAFAVFVATSLLAGSRVGQSIENFVFDWLAPTWSALSRRVLPGLFRLTVETFRALADLLERLLYKVDEWLRFRTGETLLVLVAKATLGMVWMVVAYAVRLYFTLLIEPEINPLKHFPVVTVSHKLMIPFAADLLHALNTALSPLGSVIGGAIAGTTVFLLPSVSGFLVWELKENWKLYRTSRPAVLGPVPIGHHGESMGALMIPGFHSGTLPKLYERMRRTAQREEAEATGPESVRARAEGSLGRFREGIQEVEHGVQRFVERELLPLLHSAPRWTFGRLEVASVELNSNRVRVRLSCAALGGEPCEIAFEEQSQLILASVPVAGFIAAIPTSAADARVLLENALAGLYHLAGVDLVREQIEAALGGGTPYDISDEGLVVWPGDGYRTEAVYHLHSRPGGPMIEPVFRGDPPPRPPQPLDVRQILYRHQSISWSAWVYAWSAGERTDAAIPRLIQGASILPRSTRASAASLDEARVHTA